MTTVYFSSEDLAGNPMASGLENISAVLERQLESVYVRGRTALIKPNMVDPSIPQACTNPATIECIASALRRRGAGPILVGDEPAAYIYELASRRGTRFSIRKAYRDTSYDQIPGVELVDLSDTSILPVTSYSATVFNPLTGREEQRDIPIRDTSEYLLINCTLPKHHGNFNYGGASKNLMGLVPQNQRVPYFHQSFYKEARDSFQRAGITTPDQRMLDDRAQRFAMLFSMQYQDHLTRTGADPDTGSAQRVRTNFNAGLLDRVSLICHMEHIVNAGALVGLVEHIHSTNPDAIHLIDGTAFLTRQEHEGLPERMDFAAAGRNPAYVDIAVAGKLVVDPSEVPYLEQLQAVWGNPSVQGDIGLTNPGGRPLIPKEVFTDRHGFHFLRIR